LNAVCPDGFEYYFVDEEFVVGDVKPSDISGIKKNPWSEPASELYRPSDRRLSAKLLPTFADRGCHVVSVTDPYCRILGFLEKTATFLSSSSSVVLTRLSGARSRPTTLKKEN
jgi:hypothetical protein